MITYYMIPDKTGVFTTISDEVMYPGQFSESI